MNFKVGDRVILADELDCDDDYGIVIAAPSSSHSYSTLVWVKWKGPLELPYLPSHLKRVNNGIDRVLDDLE